MNNPLTIFIYKLFCQDYHKKESLVNKYFTEDFFKMYFFKMLIAVFEPFFYKNSYANFIH